MSVVKKSAVAWWIVFCKTVCIEKMTRRGHSDLARSIDNSIKSVVAMEM